jgi:hypothetical protein
MVISYCHRTFVERRSVRKMGPSSGRAVVPVKNSIRPTVPEFGRRGMLAARVGPSPHPSRPGAVMILVLGVWAFVRALLVNSAAVSLENVALRHQLAVLQRSGGRPRLRRRDRIFWVCLSRLWANWRASLISSTHRGRVVLAHGFGPHVDTSMITRVWLGSADEVCDRGNHFHKCRRIPRWKCGRRLAPRAGLEPATS